MLSQEEVLQICRKYELKCGICETDNAHFRLARDIVRAAKTEGDGHALEYKWNKPGFDGINPLNFFWGVCDKCRYTGELDDANFRQAERDIKRFREGLHGDGLRTLLTGLSTGSGIAQSLGKRLADADPLVVVVAQFHLGIFSHCLSQKIAPGNIARYYLRLAWVFRDVEKYYPDSDPQQIEGKFGKLAKRFKGELPKHDDYPMEPGLALNERDALRFACAYFERNYEMLREAKPEDELRLRYLMAEIGYRLYELTDAPEDFKRAATFFSGTMQQCLSIISDKSIVGGAVNRAKEMLDKAGERGRELRILNKSRGGDGEADEGDEGTAKKKAKPEKGKVKAKKADADRAANGEAKKGDAARARAANGEAAKAKAKVKPAQGAGAAAPPAKEQVGEGAGQSVRQAAILQQEVDRLQERVKELEEDNKRWRQLAGRDALTGFSSKAMLVRFALPKLLKQLAKSGPYSCYAISFDEFARVNNGHGWSIGDKMLKESARSLRKLSQEADGDEWYRLDGAHFALVSRGDNNVARQRSSDLRRKLSKVNVQVDQTHIPLISSIGVVTVERALSDSLGDVSNKIYEALMQSLSKAKGKGGNTVDIFNATKF